MAQETLKYWDVDSTVYSNHRFFRWTKRRWLFVSKQDRSLKPKFRCLFWLKGNLFCIKVPLKENWFQNYFQSIITSHLKIINFKKFKWAYEIDKQLSILISSRSWKKQTFMNKCTSFNYSINVCSISPFSFHQLPCTGLWYIAVHIFELKNWDES